MRLRGLTLEDGAQEGRRLVKSLCVYSGLTVTG